MSATTDTFCSLTLTVVSLRAMKDKAREQGDHRLAEEAHMEILRLEHQRDDFFRLSDKAKLRI